eukprot:TRINITY_DN6621_c0_g1_i5.p1 TRINITY_DN6621_c0_g1~~TRINITY_DN6621_c0_g1_i5.p1  ORF type:complete len:390 (+),score=115.44 TRINITY_DN6621_c0_g1_i5:63-1232(+)
MCIRDRYMGIQAAAQGLEHANAMMEKMEKKKEEYDKRNRVMEEEGRKIKECGERLIKEYVELVKEHESELVKAVEYRCFLSMATERIEEELKMLDAKAEELSDMKKSLERKVKDIQDLSNANLNNHRSIESIYEQEMVYDDVLAKRELLREEYERLKADIEKLEPDESLQAKEEELKMQKASSEKEIHVIKIQTDKVSNDINIQASILNNNQSKLSELNELRKEAASSAEHRHKLVMIKERFELALIERRETLKSLINNLKDQEFQREELQQAIFELEQQIEDENSFIIHPKLEETKVNIKQSETYTEGEIADAKKFIEIERRALKEMKENNKYLRNKIEKDSVQEEMLSNEILCKEKTLNEESERIKREIEAVKNKILSHPSNKAQSK